MFERITKAIRSRSRREWEDYFKGRLNWLREYSQTNGEKAAIAGFLLGSLVVVFYQVALIVACITLVVGQLILILAEDAPRNN
jgi:hypothetical protein